MGMANATPTCEKCRKAYFLCECDVGEIKKGLADQPVRVRLRHYASQENCDGEPWDSMQEAADLIETLSHHNESLQAEKAELVGLLREIRREPKGELSKLGWSYVDALIQKHGEEQHD